MRNPARAALVGDGLSLSHAETLARSLRIAAALDTLAPPAGRQLHVAVYSPNHPLGFLAVLSVLQAGAVWVPVNVRNGVEENTLIVQRSDCDVLIFHSTLADKARTILAGAPAVRFVFCLDRELPWAPHLDRFVEGCGRAEPVEPPDDPRAGASLLSTGGTTGTPKGALWSNDTWEAFIANFWIHMPAEEPPVFLMVTPMTHAAGAIAIPLLARGATCVILPGFEAETVMEAIGRYRVTHLFLPPTAIYGLLAHPGVRDHDYSSLRYFIYSAAPMSAEKLREAMEVFGPVMTQGYGQAEVPLLVTFLGPEEHVRIERSGRLDRFTSCGRPTLLADVRIVDDRDRELPPGGIGEIVLRSRLLCEGYYDSPDLTAETRRGGWHHTGDIGRFDEDGFLYIVDRKKDMIITGGFNVFSSEVEQVILTHPAVEQCAVIGVPDAKWGEAIKAVVKLKAGASLDGDEMIRLCKDRLGSVKAPKSVEVWPELPLSPVGKVLKRSIRDRFWTGQSRRV